MFDLTKLGIIIDVIEPVSAMESIEFSPNLAAIRMQRLPLEVAARKLGVTSLKDFLLESLVETLALCFWAFVRATYTMVCMMMLFEQNRGNSDNFLVFDLL